LKAFPDAFDMPVQKPRDSLGAVDLPVEDQGPVLVSADGMGRRDEGW
jgi:hypothetical protein